MWSPTKTRFSGPSATMPPSEVTVTAGADVANAGAAAPKPSTTEPSRTAVAVAMDVLRVRTGVSPQWWTAGKQEEPGALGQSGAETSAPA
ncbi:hypothetical protein ABZV67_41725 [Streptomyces sp. NPDC005065]|uniref:hypothetical protein n=1 Tax=unclassified Streptomyces TaxID=2593676 RepID=UPI0033BD1BCB